MYTKLLSATCNEARAVKVLIDSHVFVWALLGDPDRQRT